MGTPLYVAVQYGRWETVAMLLDKGACLGKKDGRDRTVWELAQARGDYKILQLLEAHCL